MTLYEVSPLKLKLKLKKKYSHTSRVINRPDSPFLFGKKKKWNEGSHDIKRASKQKVKW